MSKNTSDQSAKREAKRRKLRTVKSPPKAATVSDAEIERAVRKILSEIDNKGKARSSGAHRSK